MAGLRRMALKLIGGPSRPSKRGHRFAHRTSGASAEQSTSPGVGVPSLGMRFISSPSLA